MKKISQIILLVVLIAFFSNCGEKGDIDKEKPSIGLTGQDAFPLNCDTLYFGEPFILKVLFSDNVELGSFSIDIHHNFDHHSHSTDVAECSLDPIKSPVNPFVFIGDYKIPTGQSAYRTNMPFIIPSGNENGEYDEGDYHFFISLTDKEGWSAQKGLSIKIIKRGTNK